MGPAPWGQAGGGGEKSEGTALGKKSLALALDTRVHTSGMITLDSVLGGTNHPSLLSPQTTDSFSLEKAALKHCVSAIRGPCTIFRAQRLYRGTGEAGVLTHACHPSIQEPGAKAVLIQAQPGLRSTTERERKANLLLPATMSTVTLPSMCHRLRKEGMGESRAHGTKQEISVHPDSMLAHSVKKRARGGNVAGVGTRVQTGCLFF